MGEPLVIVSGSPHGVRTSTSSPLASVTARGTPLGASQPTGGPGGLVVVVGADVVVGAAEVDGAGDPTVVLVVVVGDLMSAAAHAASAITRATRLARRRIHRQLWHGYLAIWRNVDLVFGPLNGVRTALVIIAVLASIVSVIAGYPGAALVLMAGVAVHGLGWYYLYVTRDRADAE